MDIHGIKVTTVLEQNDEWKLVFDAPAGIKLSVVESRDLARIVREISYAPAAMHRAPSPDPTFCEEDKVL
jgi:hypothetical protein